MLEIKEQDMNEYGSLKYTHYKVNKELTVSSSSHSFNFFTQLVHILLTIKNVVNYDT